MLCDFVVVVKGGGDLATGVAHRLSQAGFKVLVTEIAAPTTVRRTVAFSEAVFEGRTTVEGIEAELAGSARDAALVWERGNIPVVVDPRAVIVQELRPCAVVDAIVAKRNTGTSIRDAGIVVALGPGFVAGVDAHAVVETNRGHNLGRVIWQGEAEPNTGIPGPVRGFTVERVLRAPGPGFVRAYRAIGETVREGDAVCRVGDLVVLAPIAGIVRGLVHDGLWVHQGMKIGDIDPRARREHCFTISDKALAVGGGVLEAILHRLCLQAGHSSAQTKIGYGYEQP